MFITRIMLAIGIFFAIATHFLAKHYSTASKNTQVADKEKQVAARRFVLYAVYNIEKQIIFIIY